CFFQAEDGIRDSSVTGVQTCALPILIKTADWVINLLRRADGDNASAAAAAIRAQIDHPFRGLDHVEVVLDHQHRVALLDEAVQRSEERRVGKEWRAPRAED